MVKIEKKYFDFDADYAMLQKWWELHGSFAPKKEHLSNTGIIIYVDNEPVCAGFIYRTDSAICVFEFVICNPEIEKEKRDSGISRLIEEVKKWSSENRYSLIYTSVKSPKYIQRLIQQDFILIDTEQSHLFCEIKVGIYE